MFRFYANKVELVLAEKEIVTSGSVSDRVAALEAKVAALEGGGT